MKHLSAKGDCEESGLIVKHFPVKSREGGVGMIEKHKRLGWGAGGKDCGMDSPPDTVVVELCETNKGSQVRIQVG